MANYREETVLRVQHWDERVFSFSTTRDPGFRFDNGQFVMIGLPVEGRPLMRAYSIASANHEETLEFLSIKVPDGPLTSRLQHIQVGERVLVGLKPTGTLLISDLKPGRNLYLLATGTGLAPFMSIIQDPATYERFSKVVLLHGVRYSSELAYHDYILNDLPQHEFLGELVKEQLLYYPTLTREIFEHRGRLPDLLRGGKVAEDLGLDNLDAQHDRAMICGSPAMLKDLSALLDEMGFAISPRIGEAGDYVIERAFVVR
jgi:ferredoxin/flavodoxin---NADP+ reductase